MGALSSDLQQQREAREKLEKEAAAEAQQARARSGDAELQLTVLQNRLTSMEERALEAEAKALELATSLGAAGSDREHLQTKVDELGRAVTAAKEEHTRATTTLLGALSEAEQREASLQSQLEAAKEQLAEVTERLAEVESRAEQLNTNLEVAVSRADQVQVSTS